ncbi:MAG TPA: site-specific integrase [Acidimicrobiales bacterium]|nr:site-specific integrase [Acidimicrobiales bacterium]
MGRLETTTTVIGLRLVDGADEEILPASEFLSSLLASGASQSSLRSYALGLLRWWRFLEAVGVPWDRASRVETRDFVLWMRSGGKRPPDGSPARSPFAAATINHNLAVLRGFYGDRLAAGVGPVINPVPDSVGRRGQRPHAHHNPMQPFEHHRRAPLRQRTPAPSPRACPIGSSTTCSPPWSATGTGRF